MKHYFDLYGKNIPIDSNDDNTIEPMVLGRFIHFNIMYFFPEDHLNFTSAREINSLEDIRLQFIRDLDRNELLLNDMDKPLGYRYFKTILEIEKRYSGLTQDNIDYFSNLFDCIVNNRVSLTLEDLTDKINLLKLNLCKEVLLLVCNQYKSIVITNSDLKSDHLTRIEDIYE